MTLTDFWTTVEDLDYTPTDTTEADTVRAAAHTQYGHEDGATDDINNGTPVLLIEATAGRAGYGRTVTILHGPAIRLTDGTHLPIGDFTETYGTLRAGRAGRDDTAAKAARRALASVIAATTLPVDIVRVR